ncbi:flagellar hook-associated protein FlgK [Aquamicrobium sp. LC103]|uniref:flagellar hook-associated protein FlgK n=1 Tax=Aquamicrobium sp. LC103 TaxID=1120658 RepID=UPI00063EBC8B|nr:flagellar hook-associated protein FlgK [Aquamicrobium sp. LC103]TKT77499.1 flagellar hook-associated protein FlgK [Aquamicrobium sp. LC103]
MSLSTALSIAQNSLLNTSRQLGVVSRNLSEVGNPDYARRSATLSSLAPGARIVQIQRAMNDALFKQNLTALSGWTAQDTIVSGLDRLQISVNGVDNSTSAAKSLGEFQNALQLYSANPSNRTLGENAVEIARTLVRNLNNGTSSIQSFRTDMDRQIAAGVDELNGLLADFKTANDEITAGTRAGRDVLDALDRRDALLKKISELVPISTITRGDNDVVIVTSDGATLFETSPRAVTFEPTPAYGAGSTGNNIRIDGVPLTAGAGGNTTAGGSLAAMMQLRDQTAVGMQLQLDETARALNDAIPGLLTFTGNITDPGFAGRISVNAAIDHNAGGNPELLRDGILANANPDGNASFNDLLIGYLEALEAPRTFQTAAGATASMSLMGYTADSVSWLEANRKAAASGAEAKSALLMKTSTALSNVTNVNEDEEMALLLELEHSYAASARLLQTIDNMLAVLLDATR